MNTAKAHASWSINAGPIERRSHASGRFRAPAQAGFRRTTGADEP
jgi:hypothetical protein